MKNSAFVKITVAVLLMSAVRANAQVTLLDFEGLNNLEMIENFYDGGLGGGGSGPGPDLNITFSGDALAIIDQDAGGTGNFGGEPSPSTIMFFVQNSAVMNVPDGFSTGFSFFYTAPIQAGMITVYDGLNATGNVLATLSLPLTPFNAAPDPTGVNSPLVSIGVPFDGVARSVDFGGTANFVGYDNVTLGSAVPVGAARTTAPAMQWIGYPLLAAGLVLFGARRVRGRREQRPS